MSRNLRELPNDLNEFQKQDLIDDNSNLRSYEITVVTPIFGGSHKAGEVDEETPVRESTVRGNLRFWWRATRGTAFDNVYELRKREREIFGDTTQPSSVKVFIEGLSRAECGRYTPGKGRSYIPPYLFQQVKNEDQSIKEVSYLSNYSFKLNLKWSDRIKKLQTEKPDEFKEFANDLNAALWGWINFGGIGSRTRRGAGSLYCAKFSPKKFQVNAQEFSKWLTTCQNQYQFKLVDQDETKEWPTLSSRMRIKANTSDYSSSHEFNWRKVLGAYKDFRRRANTKTEYDSKKQRDVIKPTRSHWPEADSIREVLDFAHPKHQDPLHHYNSKPKEEVIGFPRAVLGMPIIFQFKPIKENPQKYLKVKKARRSNISEPPTTQLTPAGKERLASPIILKPLAFEVTKSIALIAVLNHPKIDSLELKVTEGRMKDSVRLVPLNTRPFDYDLSPLKGTTKLHSNAIDAFLDSKEVKDFCNPQNS